MFAIKKNGSELYFSDIVDGDAVYSDIDNAFLYRRTQACEKEIAYLSLEDVYIFEVEDDCI